VNIRRIDIHNIKTGWFLAGMTLFVLALGGFRAPSGDLDRFWYPVALIEVSCGDREYNAYLMDHSTGARDWPFIVDIKTKREITLPDTCTTEYIKRYPRVYDSGPLTDFQKSLMIRATITGDPL